ncbi:MAG: hypothetical protein RQ735_04565 [Flavobacteriaceae bacterium]|nr:hypothetical protein [Flavobacteriaceae bacterium]
MQLESALEKLSQTRKGFHDQRLKRGKIFSGIKNLDKALLGFDVHQFYTLVARPGNLLHTFTATFASNIDVLYHAHQVIVKQKPHDKEDGFTLKRYWQFLEHFKLANDYSEIFDIENLPKLRLKHEPVLLIADSNLLTENQIKTIKIHCRNWGQNKVLVFLLFLLEEESTKPISLDELPPEITNHSDVIISLFRPEYYKIDTWEDGTSTQNQLEFSVIKNSRDYHPKGKLWIDKEKKRLRSEQSTLLQKWSKKIQENLK